MYTGTHIKDVLRARERSVAWLARKMGRSESFVHRVIDGERTITADFVERACAALELPAMSLFFSPNDMPMRIRTASDDEEAIA